MKKVDTCYIIDDDPIAVFGIKLLMKRTGFCDNPTVYGNGEDAFVALQQCIDTNETTPSVIFLDLDMPIMDGWTFLSLFEEIEPQKRKNIILNILSSSVNPSELKRAREHPLVHAYFPKPLKEENLSELIEELS